MRRVLLVTILTIGWSAPVQAEFQIGLDASERGATAVHEWKVRAEGAPEGRDIEAPRRAEEGSAEQRPSPVTMTARRDGSLRQSYKGFTLISLSPEPGAELDVTLVEPRQGLDNLRQALDLARGVSLFHARLETLKSNGAVYIVYDPHFPREQLHHGKFAVFLPRVPDSLKLDLIGKGQKDFLMIVGRHGIKWPTVELAYVLVHELVGHGTQHLRGRLQTLPLLALECEAWLYQEQAFQDFKIGKRSEWMVLLRKNLERVYCVGFKRYMRQHQPALVDLWNELDPDVPRLLTIYEHYVTFLHGLAEQYRLGYAYEQGADVAQDYARAARLNREPAKHGYVQAQKQPRRPVRQWPGRVARRRAGGKVVPQGRRTGLCPGAA